MLSNTAYVRQGEAEKALLLYERMQKEGMSPNVRTFVSTLQACGLLAEKEDERAVGGQVTKVKSLEKGRAIHADAQEKVFDSDVFVANTLISMYGKCGSVMDAQRVFDRLSRRDVVSWTALITAYAQQSQATKALQLYEQMRLEGMILDVRTFVSALQACATLAEKEEDTLVEGRLIKFKALTIGNAIHADAEELGYDSNVVLCSTLLSMYGKCGSNVDAQTLFDKLPCRNIVLWNVMIGAYVRQGQAEKGWQLYDEMLGQGVSPNVRTVVHALQACCTLAAEVAVGTDCIKFQVLEKGKAIHAYAQRKCFDSDVFVGNTLINLYEKCGDILDAQSVFNGLHNRDVVSWNMMLVAYVQQGQADKAMKLYETMHEDSLSPDLRTFVGMLQACSILVDTEKDSANGELKKAMSLGKARAIHAYVWRNCLDADIFVGTALVSLYGRCGTLVDSQNVFYGLSLHDIVAWNAIIVAHVQQGQAEKAMQLYEELQECVSPNSRTFVIALQACCLLAGNEAKMVGQSTKLQSLGMGRAIHAAAWKKGYDCDDNVGNTLVCAYAKCMSIKDAEQAFLGLSKRDTASSTAMLRAYVQVGLPEKAFQLYEKMKVEGISQNASTFVSALQACAMLAEMEEVVVVQGHATKLKSLTIGRALHADARSKGYGSDVFVGNTLVNMYRKCGSMLDAQTAFNELSCRDVVSWNGMLSVYVQHGQAEEAWHVYEQMQEAAVSPDNRTFVSLLQACGMLADQEVGFIVDGRLLKRTSLERARIVHSHAQRNVYGLDVFVGSSLVAMYAKCGSIVDAESVFNGLCQRDIVTWTAMLSVYVQLGQGEKALQLYRQMEEECLTLDVITIVCLLKACSSTGSLGHCQRIYQRVLAAGDEMFPLLANTLIHTYARCASMVDAQAVFDILSQPDVVSWTALMAGYALEGDYCATLQCYDKMLLAGVKPDGITFLSILSACSHAGLVNKGVEYFESMNKDHGVAPEIEHFVCMADLLGRAGLFTRLERLLLTMPLRPTLPMWLCVMGACRKYGNVPLGKRAFHCAVALDPKHPAAYMLMSNIYIDAGLRECGIEVGEMRQKAGAWKEPGHTWIGHQQDIYTFVVGDLKHPQQELLYELLAEVASSEKDFPPNHCMLYDSFERESGNYSFLGARVVCQESDSLV